MLCSFQAGLAAVSYDPFPVISREDYPEFLKLPGHDFTSNHETWAHRESLLRGSAAGGAAVPVSVRPAEFREYCEKNNLPFTRHSLNQCAYEKLQAQGLGVSLGPLSRLAQLKELGLRGGEAGGGRGLG